MRLLAAILLVTGCGLREAAPADVATSGVRRLTRAEYDATVADLLGDTSRRASTFLPNDVVDPFDNDRTTQAPSAVVVTGFEALANAVAADLVADSERRDQLVTCDVAEEACVDQFVTELGRRALRRPLEAAEIRRLTRAATELAEETGEPWDAVDVVVRVLLQHPAFVYRVEIGSATGTPGVYRLDGYEIATRLAYLLWGTTPDDWLLDQAAEGRLDAPDGVEQVGRIMLDDPRARDRIDRFHAMWLGYWQLPHEAALTERMRAETRALVERVVFDDGASWLELFTAPDTWVDATLAEHYGMPAPGDPSGGWVAYSHPDRMGILSHGSFLSVNAKFGDTSPTLRGKLVRERLMCTLVPPPPPDVNVDEPPGAVEEGDCKIDRYAAHSSVGSCKGCHELVDPIGFGLEGFDREGRARDHDEGDERCLIDGVGALDGAPFTGPAGLAERLLEDDAFPACAVEQTWRFSMGQAPGAADRPWLAELEAAFADSGHRLDALLLSIVSDERFSYRREDAP